MSLRQIRKLKALKQAVERRVNDEEEEPEVEAEVDLVAHHRRPVVFSKLALESDDSDSSSSCSSFRESSVSPAPNVPMEGLAKKPLTDSKKPNAKKMGKKPVESNEMKSIGYVLDPALKIDVRAFNPSSELRRIFGSSAASGPFRGIKRRHWLIEPQAAWPLVVKDCFKMEITAEKSFRLLPEPDYESKLKILSRIVITHDIDALYQFVQFNPFHTHGLIQLASILIEKGEFENAYQLVRRSLYALQSSFLPSFHPNQSVLLSNDSVFSSILLRALLLYSHLLAGQGCCRTSLEIMKLVYALEGGMHVGCPHTHALLHLEAAAYKADQFGWISSFVSANKLTQTFPGSAFLFAIAQKKRGIDSETISITEIKNLEISESTPATCALIRALLRFPFTVKLIFGRDNPKGVSKTSDPFINKLALAFSIKCSSRIKIDQPIIQWIDDIIEKQLPVILSQGLSQLDNTVPLWLSEGYSNLSSAEFEWGKNASGSFVEPRNILDSEAHILEMYSDEGPNSGNASAAPPLRFPVSLESNPVAAFFQTLLPWSSIDTTGTEATPLTADSLLRRLQSSLGIDRDTAPPVIQDAAGHDGSGSESLSSDDEEIIMDRQ